MEYIKDGLKHMQLKFYIEGVEPGLKGIVHSESKEVCVDVLFQKCVYSNSSSTFAFFKSFCDKQSLKTFFLCLVSSRILKPESMSSVI